MVSSRLRRILVAIAASQIVAWVVGQVVGRRMSRGDERSDDFRVVTILGGRQFDSHAEHLRSGAVVASMGGVDLDLRHATLDPEGAVLDVRTTMGGVQVTVPDRWAVDVDRSGFGGGVETRVTAPDELPADAPKLRVRVVANMGGVVVTNAHR